METRDIKETDSISQNLRFDLKMLTSCIIKNSVYDYGLVLTNPSGIDQSCL